MTDDDEFQRQARILLSMRRLSERLRSLPFADQLRRLSWFRQQQEQEWSWQEQIGKEERREQAEIRQEPVSPAQYPPPEPELREASDDQTRTALRAIYKRYSPKTGPSLSAIVPLVKADLEPSGLTKSKQRIQDIASEKEFDGARAPQGKHRT